MVKNMNQNDKRLSETSK